MGCRKAYRASEVTRPITLIPCGMPSPLTCWSPGQMFGEFNFCLGIAVWQQRRAI